LTLHRTILHHRDEAASAACGTTRPSPAGRRDVQEDGRPFWVKTFDVAAVGTLVVLLLVLAARVAADVVAGAPWWLLPPALVAGLVCADLVSGLVHWLCDTFLAETTPVIGRTFIRPFREHHRDPLAITRHGFFELCGNNALAVLGPVLLAALDASPATSPATFALRAFVLLFALAVFLTNLFHQWAHAPALARPLRRLQASGLILSPGRHAEHHRGDFSRAYCVTTGWLNAPLDASRALPRCARALRRRRAHSAAGARGTVA
jgi:ubiquitin-conjugating enzyme E2 variant